MLQMDWKKHKWIEEQMILIIVQWTIDRNMNTWPQIEKKGTAQMDIWTETQS